MINSITTVYFTDESEYISNSGSLLKFSEQSKMIKQSMVSEEKIIADSFKDGTPLPFGTLLNFFVSADWHTICNECRVLLEEYKNITERNVSIYDGFKAFMDETEIFPYFKAIFLINNVYDKLCGFSAEMAELFMQCTISKYFDSLYEYADVSDFFVSVGLADMSENLGSPKEIIKTALQLIDEPYSCIAPLLLNNSDILAERDSGLTAVMYYIIKRLNADLRELSVCAENIKKSASEIIEADKKITAKAAEILSINKFIPMVDYGGISQISEEYFEAYSRSAAKISMEEKLKYRQIQKIKAVRFNSLYSAVCYEINHIYFIGGHLSKCEACGKYFSSKTTRARYCSDCVKAEEYAKQYVKIDEYKKLYLKNNKAYNARYNRDLSIGDEYHKWQENAKKILKEAQDGGYTFEEFSKLIALPPSEKKAGRYPK
ncbi:MAG: hypothetical protein K2N26_08935 [Oscillospiraceae bacterium]|nr:hypothetical protein [Oscillospiraceae bacterium]